MLTKMDCVANVLFYRDVVGLELLTFLFRATKWADVTPAVYSVVIYVDLVRLRRKLHEND
ncbi:hypothetical protein GCM10009092_08020 [Bowmanella denitrificans]|uniref:Uncharacterized protein n=1 Tax=Bowmanella denitrificans TaxID=366582 RepID=A0ABP3GHU1_9ALTE